MKNKIMNLKDINTFWDDVRNIIGYYEGKSWSDWQIKEFQRIADYRYDQLLEERKNNNDK